MIRIAITQAAFDAICATLPLGSVGLRERDQRAGRAPDLGSAVMDRQRAMRGSDESYSDAILRLVEADGAGVEIRANQSLERPYNPVVGSYT
jgi:hypothetical protein